MRERPILMSGPLVRAVLDGRKTQTRRVVKKGIALDWLQPGMFTPEYVAHPENHMCPYGDIGDRLWVREAHAIFQAHGQHRSDGMRWGPWGGLPTVLSPDGTQIAYFREGFDRCSSHRWRPSIHMPRWASRLSLRITDVRVERLQGITTDDAIAEGAVFVDHGKTQWGDTAPGWHMDPAVASKGPGHCLGSARFAFGNLWNSLAPDDRDWDSNPWVWAISFAREGGAA